MTKGRRESMMRRILLSAAVAGVVLAGPAPHAFAINDGRVPADECSGNPNAVGTPGGQPNPGLLVADPVGPPASANNPGRSTGAQGEAHSRAEAHCPNATAG